MCLQHADISKHDIALLELGDPLEVASDEVFSMDGLDGSVSSFTQANASATVYGYSAIIDSIPISSHPLTEMDVRLSSGAECVEAGAHHFMGEDADKQYHLCYPKPKSSMGACQGDSGGVLAVLDSKGLPWAAGVIVGYSTPPSSGSGCLGKDRVGITVATRGYGSWMQATISGSKWECNTCPCYGQAFGVAAASPSYRASRFEHPVQPSHASTTLSNHLLVIGGAIAALYAPLARAI
jgi:secreted trypsin-like serine protease